MEEKMKKTVEQEYKFFLILSIIFGIMNAFCLYQNDAGITYPLLVIVFLAEFYLGITKLEIPCKKSFFYYGIAAVLLSISICITDDTFIHFMDKIGILILAAVIAIDHNPYGMDWKFISCLKNITTLIIEMMIEMGSPVIHLYKGIKNKEKNSNNNRNNGKQILIGIAIGIPLVFVVLIFLGIADQIFGDMLLKIIRNLFFFPTMMENILLIILGIWFFYMLFVASESKREESSQEETKSNPVIAITFTSMLTIIYLLFCSIQIMYLFRGGMMELPSKFSYATYARKGFFELLFVSMINFTIVTICLGKFKDSKVLRIILTIFSGCTFILITSSAYRMILYIKAYHLTFLRILVLWFLIVLAVWMAGAVWQIYKRDFPLFQYVFITALSLYIIYAFSGENKIIAKYNLHQGKANRLEQEASLDLEYLVKLSSCDIADVLLEYSQEEGITKEEQDMIEVYFTRVIENYRDMNLREYNISRNMAYRAGKEYFKRQK